MPDLQPIDLPPGLEYWTADAVAECLDSTDYLPDGYIEEHYGGDKWGLYTRLWQAVSDAKNPTPLGGDESNGTVETPDGRLDLDNDDKAGHWWHLLAPAEQHAISAAYAAEYK